MALLVDNSITGILQNNMIAGACMLLAYLFIVLGFSNFNFLL